MLKINPRNCLCRSKKTGKQCENKRKSETNPFCYSHENGKCKDILSPSSIAAFDRRILNYEDLSVNSEFDDQIQLAIMDRNLRAVRTLVKAGDRLKGPSSDKVKKILEQSIHSGDLDIVKFIIKTNILQYIDYLDVIEQVIETHDIDVLEIFSAHWPDKLLSEFLEQLMINANPEELKLLLEMTRVIFRDDLIIKSAELQNYDLLKVLVLRRNIDYYVIAKVIKTLPMMNGPFVDDTKRNNNLRFVKLLIEETYYYPKLGSDLIRFLIKFQYYKIIKYYIHLGRIKYRQIKNITYDLEDFSFYTVREFGTFNHFDDKIVMILLMRVISEKAAFLGNASPAFEKAAFLGKSSINHMKLGYLAVSEIIYDEINFSPPSTVESLLFTTPSFLTGNDTAPNTVPKTLIEFVVYETLIGDNVKTPLSYQKLLTLYNSIDRKFF